MRGGDGRRGLAYALVTLRLHHHVLGVGVDGVKANGTDDAAQDVTGEIGGNGHEDEEERVTYPVVVEVGRKDRRDCCCYWCHCRRNGSGASCR